jgi:hypothetical protein
VDARTLDFPARGAHDGGEVPSQGRYQMRRVPRRRAPTIVTATVLVAALLGPFVPRPAEAAIPALPTSELRTPAIAASAPGRVDLFARTSTGRLSYRYRLPGGSWTRILDLGGSLASQPAATSRARLHVAVRWTDGTIRYRSTTSTGWTAWTSLGGSFTSAPAIASPAPGRLDVMARATDGRLRWKTSIDGTWSAWRTLSGVVASSPALISRDTGRLSLFARRSDGHLIARSYAVATGWSQWHDRGGNLASQPAAVSPTSDRVDVVARHTDGTMRLLRWYQPTGWGTWTTMAGGPFATGPSATHDGVAVRLAAVQTNGQLRHAIRRTVTGTWSSWVLVDALLPIRDLGTWVDAYDYGLNPEASVADMKARGVHTLFLATARFSSASDIQNPALAGRWLDAAHANGIKVVGWYVPGYGDLARDVRRTVAIERFVSPGGQRFDAVGVNIERFRNPGDPIGEFTGEVYKDAFLTLLVTHLQQVRAQTHGLLVAIVPTPYTTDPGNRWSGFPWASVGRYSDVTVPMVLWSFRTNPDGSPLSEAQVRAYVANEIVRTGGLTGDAVHVEGGVAGEGTTPVTAERVRGFVNGAVDGGAKGGSHYDYATTAPALWSVLVRLNAL